MKIVLFVEFFYVVTQYAVSLFFWKKFWNHKVLIPQGIAHSAKKFKINSVILSFTFRNLLNLYIILVIRLTEFRFWEVPLSYVLNTGPSVEFVNWIGHKWIFLEWWFFKSKYSTPKVLKNFEKSSKIAKKIETKIYIFLNLGCEPISRFSFRLTDDCDSNH